MTASIHSIADKLPVVGAGSVLVQPRTVEYVQVLRRSTSDPARETYVVSVALWWQDNYDAMAELSLTVQATDLALDVGIGNLAHARKALGGGWHILAHDDGRGCLVVELGTTVDPLNAVFRVSKLDQ